MNIPLTPGMSALLYIPEDNVDYHEHSPTQLEANNYNDTTNSQLQNFTFENNNNKLYDLDAYTSYAQRLSPTQLSLQNQYEVPPAVNDTLGETADNPFLTDFLTTSMFQIPTNTTPSPFQNHDFNNNGTLHNDNNEYENPAFAVPELRRHSVPSNFSSNVPFIPHYNRLPNESSLYGQQSSEENSTSPYSSAETLQHPYVPSQPKHHYDAFGNVVSPLRVMNEQYELNQNAFATAGLDSSYLVPAPPLPNLTPPSFERRTSKSSKSNSHLVPPPPLPPAPPPQPGDPPVKVKRRRRRKPPPPPEVAAAKHKAFLQRNREAASKCRTKKKAQINNLEDEERISRQINVALKDKFEGIMGEVRMLREQIKDMPCDEDCEGCGEHAPLRRDSVLATSSIGTGSVRTGSIGTGSVEEEDKEDDGDEKSEDEDDGNTESAVGSLQSPLSVDSRFQNFNFKNSVATSETTAGDNNQTLWNKRKRDESDTIRYQGDDGAHDDGQSARRQSSAYLEGYTRKQT